MHCHVSCDPQTEGGPGPLLFTTPGDIFSHTESDDEPIAMTTKQVKWGPNKLFDEKSEKSHDPPHRENPRPPARPKVTKVRRLLACVYLAYHHLILCSLSLDKWWREVTHSQL